MSYYIISFAPEQLKQFQKRFSFLEDAIWIDDKKNLMQICTSLSGDALFLVDLNSKRESIDELVLIIREASVSAKVIYIYEDGTAPDLKSHQMTPVGGDAYVPLQIEAATFYSMLEGLMPPEINQRGNRLDRGGISQISAQQGLEELRNNPKSKEIEKKFSEVFGAKSKKPSWQSASNLKVDAIPDELEVGDDMSDKDQELSLDDLGELEISASGETEIETQEDAGIDFDLGDDVGLDLADPDEQTENSPSEDLGMDLDLDEGFSLDDSESDDSFSLDDEAPEVPSFEEDLSLDDDNTEIPSFGEDLSLDDSAPEIPEVAEDLSLSSEEVGLEFGSGDSLDINLEESEGEGLSLSDELTLDEDDSLASSVDIDLSDDAKEKLKEIDAIMDFDASQVGITMDLSKETDEDEDNFSLEENLLVANEEPIDSDIDMSLVSDDLDLGSINFSSEEEEVEKEVASVVEEKTKKKNKEPKEARESYDGAMGRELKEISGAYSGEMERMQATISNLRSDREELLAKIQKLEEDRVLQNRQSLTMRAELDEKKIELSIIRKKLNDEVSELKDRLKLFEEKKLILEEKNKIMVVELDKAAHKNKIDVKKIQMRERELEQKLELLKADSESQIRHRDLKILELKRKLDAMEFDIESISVQEKRSVESRFELEDKLDKAIKTLRNAITVLEDESDNSGVLEALKKNIDM
jgi:hypothetical protein